MSNKFLLPQVALSSTQILTQLSSGQLLAIDSRRRGGLIICKRHHVEFAGPGSAVGGICDIDCGRVIPIGDLALIHPASFPDRQKAFTMRQKWFRSILNVMETQVPLKRAGAILYLLEKYFGSECVNPLPDEIIAQLIGVLPKTVKMVRQARANQSPNQHLNPKLAKV